MDTLTQAEDVRRDASEHGGAALAAAAVAPMPVESPLAMPVQNFRRFDASERRAWTMPALAYTPWASRLLVFGGGLLLTIYGAMEMFAVVNVGAITPLKWALLVLFVANFSWIAIAFTSGVLGF
ncbi:MAG: glucans biosynthesis glucosyltransferase MdoH, partial [Hyphomicrobiales bacterium]|nr:glucans biosynthesis glucosyltransferase MdoH [Hyphomicrobiales bacterium]